MTKMEHDLLKIGGDRKEGMLSQVRQGYVYLAIKEHKEEFGYSVELSCRLLNVSRAAYCRWLRGKKCARS